MENNKNEEIQSLKKEIEYWKDQTKVAREEIDNAVKETAREILQWLKEHYDGIGWCLIETYFKEQFDVEIKG